MPAKSKSKSALKEATPKSGAYMSVQEQEELQEKHYKEALRFMDNAKDCLKKAQKEGNYFLDTKYVKMACGTAYSGVLVGLDGYLALKGIHPDKKVRKTIEYYQYNLGKLDKKMLVHLVSAYQILHLSGYYDGIQNVTVINEGFNEAKSIINKIKPTNGSEYSVPD
jgi:hypothetical protein